MKCLARPPIIAFVLIVIAAILHFIYPIMKIIMFPANLLGIAFIVLGLFIAFSGKKEFANKKAPLIPGSKPTKLVVTGAFEYSRNPMYFGFVLFLLGIAVLFGSLIAFLAPLGFFLIIELGFMPWEEKMMKKAFGKKYLAYRKKVRRWI